MNELMRRRRMMLAQNSPWELIMHNDFDRYTAWKANNGNLFEIMDGGTWVRVVSNGNNNNNSKLYNSHRYTYDDIKDKLCRLTWTIECDDPETFASTTSFGNVTIGLYKQQTQTSGDTTPAIRTAKYDIATSNIGNYLGHNTIEFVPSQVFSGRTISPYFGWNIGFRSVVNGLTISIIQFDFEVT